MAHAADVMGDRWVLLILRSVLYGVSRFADLQAELGISRGILSERLERLVQAGLLERHAYQETGARPREEYRPTKAARALTLAFAALQQWGDVWLRAAPPPARPRSRLTGEPLKVAFVTSDGVVTPERDVIMG